MPKPPIWYYKGIDMKIVLLAFALATSLNAFSQTDYQCVNDCTTQGYQYGLCTDRCTINDSNQFNSPQIQPAKQIDYQCVNDCSAKGYQYNLCTNRCSF